MLRFSRLFAPFRLAASAYPPSARIWRANRATLSTGKQPPQTAPKQIDSKFYTLTDKTTSSDFVANALHGALREAMDNDVVRSDLETAFGDDAARIEVVGTRVVAQVSKTSNDPHFTARLFSAVTDEYLGGIHAFPSGSTCAPTFKHRKGERKSKWKKRKLSSIRSTLTALKTTSNP